MRTIFLSAVLIFLSVILRGQTCDSNYVLQKNRTIEMTYYSPAKKNVTGKIVYSNIDTALSPVIENVSLTFQHYQNERTITFAAKCVNGVFMSEISAYYILDVDPEITNVFVEYPDNMKVGDKLKDAIGTLKWDRISRKGKRWTWSNVSIGVAKREVEAKELITTRAGTWECFRITYKNSSYISAAKTGGSFKVTEWYAPGFGIVKIEYKDQGGAEITSIK